MRHLFATLLLLCATNIWAEPPERAEDVKPLAAGNPLPNVSLRNIDGSAARVLDTLAGKPAVLVFFRGGWCPYCNRHLSSLRTIEAELKSLGYQLIAISPDSPQSLRSGIKEHKAEYTLLSDSSAEFIRALGLAFKVDARTREKYKGHGIDLKKASGQEHYLLPVPAVYMVDGDGMITYRYANPNYKVRMDNQELLKQARIAAADG